jgi:iron complex outermembrane receptor protein
MFKTGHVTADRFTARPGKRRLLAVALAGAFPLAAWSQESQQLQRVEVTGSAIKRIDAEGPAPVEIITRKEIARTGATSVNELIRSIPSIDVFDQGEVSSNAPSGSGTANLRLRGLSESNLLVLLNGRRLPVNALYDASGAGAAFDVNLIPITAIERIEILKDGGSAIYGADAVAGVFNIITRTDYQGLEGTVNYGISSRKDAQEKRASLTGGFGDLTKDRFNILGSVDVFKRNPILRSARDLTSTVDGRSKGGTDGRSTFAPSGNVVDPNSGNNVGIPYRPCPASDLDANNVCRFDFNKSILTSYNGADRISGLGIASYQLTPDIKLFTELTYAKSKDHFQQQPAPDFYEVPITDPSQIPFTADPGTVIIGGRFIQVGPRTTDRSSQLLNLVVGAEGTSFGLDWKLNAGRGQSRVTNRDSNYLNRDLFDAATGSGQIDPTVTTNDPAAVDAVRANPTRFGVSTVEFVNAQVSGDAWKLPAGALRYAVGGSFWREDLHDMPDLLQQQGNVLGGIQQAPVDAARNIGAVFAELSIPILSNLEGQLAARYDKYPNASQTSPKVAFKYQPIPQFALRASYTESFKAAELKQLFGAQEQGAATLTDPAECAALGVALAPDGSCTVNAFLVSGSNAALKPEKGKTYNLGAVFEIASVFSGSVDFWRIKKTDDITQPTIDSAIQQGFVGRDGPRILIFTNLQNIAEQVTSGVDIDARLRFPGTPVGNVTIRDAATLYFKNTTQDQSGGAASDFNGTYATPRYRNVFIVSTDYGPWSATASLRSVGGFWDTDNPYPIADGTKKVGSEHEVDVQAQYTGWKGLTITGGVRNLFDRMPPFSNFNLTHGNYSQEGFAELYNVRGAFYYLSLNYKFF